MIETIKTLLGDAAANFSDAQIEACLLMAQQEAETYCRRKLDSELEMIAQKMAIYRLMRMNTEGLASQSFSGVSENYIDGYSADIMAALNRKRKVMVL